MSELLPNKQAPFFEGSWVGQYRAIDKDKARLFAQAVATMMANMGVADVGYDVREGSGFEFSDGPGVMLIKEVTRGKHRSGGELEAGSGTGTQDDE